jgi:ferredoxin-NADP reductase
LASIKNLYLNIHITKEKIKWYNFGRIDIKKLNFDINSEFYICGNPSFVETITLELEKKGFNKIYVERF